MNSKNNPDTNHQYSKHAMINLQPDENLIFQVKQHKIVLFAIYGGGIAGVIAFAIIIFTVLPGLFGKDKAMLANSVGIIVFIVMAAFIALFVIVLAFIYQRNGCILTNRNLAQVKRLSLFNSESIQLSLDKLQDITFEKKGIFAYIFGYGTIRCETAGEEPTFLFKFCPDPQNYSQQIIGAKEEYMKRFREHDDGVNPPVQNTNQNNDAQAMSSNPQNQQYTQPPQPTNSSPQPDSYVPNNDSVPDQQQATSQNQNPQDQSQSNYPTTTPN
jgi:hypothetical protein